MADVYVMQGYTEEVIATAFAKTSRNAGRFSDMARELDEAKSAKFHEKWVLGFGHNSVAEHAVLHFAIEGASRLAIEALQSCRLAAYMEQSTRYQVMKIENTYHSTEWSKKIPDFERDYIENTERLFDLYQKLQITIEQTDPSLGYRAYDVARFALPLSTVANVGLTINIRELRRMICKMLAHPLEEVRGLAEQLLQEGLKAVPTLLKHIKPCKVTTDSRDIIIEYSPKTMTMPTMIPINVRCKIFDVDMNEITQAMGFARTDEGYGDFKADIASFSELLANLDKHDALPREMEMGRIVFEVVSDYGSYYDMKRHRMMTLIPQATTGTCGYLMPAHSVLASSGMAEQYIQVMNEAHRCFDKWKHLPEAQYLLPNASRKRYLIQTNPRELIEIIKMRGLNPAGHSSYRTIGLLMLETAIEKCPELFGWLKKWVGENDVSSKTMDYRLYP